MSYLYRLYPDSCKKSNQPVLELLEKGLIVTAEEAEADPLLLVALDNPFVLIGATVLAAGVVWYFYSQAQQQAAQQLAQQKYCLANPTDTVCVPPFTGGQSPIPYQVAYTISYFPGSYFLINGGCANPPAPYGPIKNLWKRYAVWNNEVIETEINDGNFTYHPSNPDPQISAISYRFFLIASDQNGNSTEIFSGSSGGFSSNVTFSVASVYSCNGQTDDGTPPPLDWKDWPKDKRRAAVAMLTDDDWLSNLQQSPQGGVLPPGDQLPEGYCSFPSNGNPQCNFDPITIPDGGNPNPIPTPTPSGLPDPTPSPSPTDGSGPPTASGGDPSPPPEPPSSPTGNDPGEGDTERNPAQDRPLTKGEIKKLKYAGIDPEVLKTDIMGGDNSSIFDLYKDTKGNIYVKLKGGRSPGEPTGYNIKNY